MPPARILIIAGSDCSGGAGLQADVKTVTCLGGFAMTSVTAVTVQNTLGVSAIHAIPAGIVAAQIRACIDDIGIDAIKIGMIGAAETVRMVAATLADVRVPVIVDPVMMAKGGASLLDDDAVLALIEALLPLATIVTPNTPELIALTGTEVADEADALLAAQELLGLGPAAVLAKGGHLPGNRITDWLVTRSNHMAFTADRIETRHSHGTGCTLATAIATGLGQGLDLAIAIDRARAFVRQGLLRAPGFGGGHGPLGFYPLP